MKRLGIPFIAVLVLIAACYTGRMQPTPRWRVQRAANISPWLVGAVAVPVLAVGGYRLAVSWFVTTHDVDAARDPETGVLAGAEPITIDPGNARGAALLVHGFIGATSNFNRLPERLAENGWYVHAMRLPGHGTKPEELIGVDADSLLSAVKHEYTGLKRRYGTVALVGHSMGGTLSVLTAAETDVDVLVLAAPFFKIPHHWYYVLPVKTWAALTGDFLAWYPKGDMAVQINRREAKDNIVSYDWIPHQAVDTLFELAERAKRPGTLHAVTCPVLHVHPVNDNAADYDAARDAVGKMNAADIETVTLTRANHVIFWDYERGEANRAIVEFLDSHVPSRK